MVLILCAWEFYIKKLHSDLFHEPLSISNNKNKPELTLDSALCYMLCILVRYMLLQLLLNTELRIKMSDETSHKNQVFSHVFTLINSDFFLLPHPILPNFSLYP
jgi:hypothetical protein